MELTDKRIRALKPRAERYEVQDSMQRGLRVLVTPSGRKLFRARLQVDGVTSVHTFTPDYPQLTLAAARDALADHRRELRRRSTAMPSDTAHLTVTDLFDEWEERYLKLHRKDATGIRRAFEKDVLPAIGKTLVRDVVLRDLVLVLDKVNERGSARMASMLRSWLLQLFKFARGRGIRSDSPAIDLPTAKRHRDDGPRERVLNDEELRGLWAATANERDAVHDERYVGRFLPRVTPPTKRVLRLLLLTGMRRSEVVGARWSEIDADEAVWHLPKERTKSGRARTLPLSDLALQVIEEQRELTRGREFVFASPKSEFKKPMLASAVSQAVNDNVAKILGLERRKRETAEEFRGRVDAVAFTPHDLRRTLRSRLSSLGVNHVVARKVVGHVLDGMDAIYDRHPYLDEQRDALQKWANELRAILDGGDSKVVSMRDRARA